MLRNKFTCLKKEDLHAIVLNHAKMPWSNAMVLVESKQLARSMPQHSQVSALALHKHAGLCTHTQFQGLEALAL